MRKNIKEYLQPKNNRQIKAADSSIYILNNIENPAILVECGFLSSPEECMRLQEKDYRSELCFSIFCGMMEYIKANEGEAP